MKPQEQFVTAEQHNSSLCPHQLGTLLWFALPGKAFQFNPLIFLCGRPMVIYVRQILYTNFKILPSATLLRHHCDSPITKSTGLPKDGYCSQPWRRTKPWKASLRAVHLLAWCGGHAVHEAHTLVRSGFIWKTLSLYWTPSCTVHWDKMYWVNTSISNPAHAASMTPEFCLWTWNRQEGLSLVHWSSTCGWDTLGEQRDLPPSARLPAGSLQDVRPGNSPEHFSTQALCDLTHY